MEIALKAHCSTSYRACEVWGIAVISRKYVLIWFRCSLIIYIYGMLYLVKWAHHLLKSEYIFKNLKSPSTTQALPESYAVSGSKSISTFPLFSMALCSSIKLKWIELHWMNHHWVSTLKIFNFKARRRHLSPSLKRETILPSSLTGAPAVTAVGGPVPRVGGGRLGVAEKLPLCFFGELLRVFAVSGEIISHPASVTWSPRRGEGGK